MIVVDTNVLAYFVIRGSQTTKAENVRRRDHHWHVPSLFRHEWLNVVTRHVDQKLLTRDEALRRYRSGLALVKIDDAPPDVLRILNLHMSSGCTSYDCQFVAAAEHHGVKLVTEDQKILAAYPNVAVSLEQF
jgi:predicted nucleic acid-binding protein